MDKWKFMRLYYLGGLDRQLAKSRQLFVDSGGRDGLRKVDVLSGFERARGRPVSSSLGSWIFRVCRDLGLVEEVVVAKKRIVLPVKGKARK